MKKRGLVLLSMLCGAVLLSGCFAQKNDSSSTSNSSDRATSTQSSSLVEEAVYKVTFKQNGYKDVVREVKEGEDLTDIPATQPKEGYTVVWENVALTNIQSDITVNAQEEANEYKVTYDANGGTVTPATQKVTYDSEPVFATPTKAGYDFVTWTYNGKPVSGKWKIASNVTLVAEWIEQKKEKVTVSFVQEGQELKQVEVNKGESLALADIPELVKKTGYTAAWDKEIPGTITESITLTAVYTANEYTITYNANGGTVTPATQTVTYDDAVTLSVPERAEYEFVGWTYEGKAVASGKWTIDKDVTLVAEWKAIPKYTVTFVRAGSENVEIQVLKDGSIAESDIPELIEKKGYTAAWDKEIPETITEAIIITAVYTANEYTITYNANGGTVTAESQTVVYDSDVTLVRPEREGYYFIGWTYEGKVVVSGKWTIDDDVTLVAEWEEIEKFTVSFVQEGQATVKVEVLEGGSIADGDIPELIEKKGYTVAWDKEIPETITEAIIITAVYTANEYTITYNANGGTVTSTTQEVTYDSDVTLTTPQRAEYEFVGWTYEGKVVTSGKWTIDDNVTLVAEWKAIPKYTVTFVRAGSENVEIQVLKDGSVAESDIPELIEKKGYTAAWDKAIPETITENITITAVYTANEYTITYDANGGTVTADPQTVVYDSAVTLAVPQREGYIFVAWTYEGKAVNTEKWDIPNDVTLVAEWKEIVVVKYTVSFVQNGYDTVTIEVKEGESLASADIPKPQQVTGYIVAWENVDLTNIQSNIVVKAIETAKTYTIILNPNGGTASSTSFVITYGATYTLPTPTNGDKTFQGWKYNGVTIALSGEWAVDGEETITLIASWRDNNWTNNY